MVEIHYSISLAFKAACLYAEQGKVVNDVSLQLTRVFSNLPAKSIHNIFIEVERFEPGSVVVIYRFEAQYEGDISGPELVVSRKRCPGQHLQDNVKMLSN